MSPTTRTQKSAPAPQSTLEAPPAPSASAFPQTAEPVSVLFVCLGNICRSPLAEATFRHLSHNISSPSPNGHPLISKIDSCGTGAYHLAASPDSRSLSVLRQHSISGYTHAARKIRVPEDFQEFNYILAMDRDNLEDLEAMARRAMKKGVLDPHEVEGKVRLYGEFGGSNRMEEVGDPYYGGREGFEIAFEQVVRFGKGLLTKIEDEARKSDGE